MYNLTSRIALNGWRKRVGAKDRCLEKENERRQGLVTGVGCVV